MDFDVKLTSMQKLTIQHAFYRARLKLAEWGEDLNEYNLPNVKTGYAEDLKNMAEIDKILDDAWEAKLNGMLNGEKA
jgi:hypothetical protein